MNRINCLIITACVFLAACKKAEEKATTSTQETGIETIYPKSGGFSSTLSIPGELQAFQQVDLYAKVSSFISKILVDVGSDVKQGQLLAVLEAPEMKAQLSAASSRLKAQEALYIASSATYKRLLETSKTPGTIAANDLEQAFARQQADLAQLEAAKSTYKEVTEMQAYLEIRAPFSGNIIARNVSAGAYVGPSGRGSEQPIFSLVQQNKLRLVVNVPESYTGALNKTGDISFKVHSLPEDVFSGHIARNAGALDSRLRSQRVEIDVVNTNKKLLPGMIAEVTLPLSGSAAVLTVPNAAVLNSTLGVFVLKVDGQKVRWIPVTTGVSNDSTTVINGAISADDRLVKHASEEIRDGQEIKLRGN